MKNFTLFFYSDPHNQSHRMVFPYADYYICGGDATNMGSDQELLRFNYIIHELKQSGKCRKEFYLIPGNHDWGFEEDQGHAEALVQDAIVIIDKTFKIEGVKFHGSPYTPTFYTWAFMKSEVALGDHWNMIPDDVNVLITHGPAYGMLDNVPRHPFHAGCKTLKQKIDGLVERDLILHLFGHIHEGYGVRSVGKTTFVNGAVPSTDPNKMGALNAGFLIEIDPVSKKVVKIEEVY